MSKIRKMKLVPFDDEIDENKLMMAHLSQQSDPTIKKISVLDQTMKSILDSKLDEDTKFKLFRQTLNRLLSYKNLMTNQNSSINFSSPSKTQNLSAPLQTVQTPVPILQTSVYSTPSSTSLPKNKSTPKIPSVRQRKVKKQAIRRIKEFYQNEDSDSEEPEIWKRYNSPKSFKRIKK